MNTELSTKVFSKLYCDVLKEILKNIEYGYDIDIDELEMPEDHLPVVVRGESTMVPMDMMPVVKSFSAQEFFLTLYGDKVPVFLGK